MIHGILPVDKPLGWTSHDVVARVRRLSGQRAVGHAGTLDPLATGVLLLVLGNATRLSSYLMDAPKTYCADVVLGATTVTDDAEAPMLQRWDVENVDAANIERCLLKFLGDVHQIPPAYAAVRHNGEKLYVLARKGIEVERMPRTVRVDEIRMVSWQAPTLRLYVRCGSGTYIRSLARDIGAALGVGGYLHALQRVGSGSFSLPDCCRLDSIQTHAELARAVIPPDRAVFNWPAAVLGNDDAGAARMGRAVAVGGDASGKLRLYDADGAFLALADCASGVAKPYRVFDGRQ